MVLVKTIVPYELSTICTTFMGVNEYIYSVKQQFNICGGFRVGSGGLLEPPSGTKFF